MAEPKTYLPKSYVKAIKTQFGEILKLDVDAEALIAFAQQHKNERGYLKLDIVPRKNPDEKSTHSVCLNTYKKPVDNDDVGF